MTETETFHPDSPLIDGAMPYSGAERVSILLDYAATLIGEGRGAPGLLDPLYAEYRAAEAQETPQPPLVHPANEYEHWHEIEDDVLSLISDLLPDPWYCTLHSDDPGTVVIWSHEDES